MGEKDCRRRLNTKEMLRDITDMVSSDFYYDMEEKLYNKDTIAQREARQMIKTILDIYVIAHSVDCVACRKEKYLSKLN